MRLLFILGCSLCIFSSCSLAIHRANRLYCEVVERKEVFDVIIVPGVPLKNGQWDSVMKARVLWSVYLYKHNIAKNIIYSGAAVYTHFYEAKVMGLYAQQLGVPPQHIFYDTLAMHSTENVYYSYKLAHQLAFKTIALATDPFQSSLLKRFTRRRFKTPIQHIPVQFDLIKQMNISTVEIDSMLASKPSFVPIMKVENFKTRLKGTLGTQLYFGQDGRLAPL